MISQLGHPDEGRQPLSWTSPPAARPHAHPRRSSSAARPAVGWHLNPNPNIRICRIPVVLERGHHGYGVILVDVVMGQLITEGSPLASHPFSLYDFRMVSEEQIQAWADEAEAGYDVDELKRRGRGRPGRGAEPMQIVAVRLTADELHALDAAAAEKDMSRSEAIRAALARFAA
jgi:Ribbon-helix-helix protein, copG family